MMSRLLLLSQKSIALSYLIKFFCYILFKLISAWNELTGVLRKYGIGNKEYESILNYKDIHDGKRCFIICTGPSLTIKDLELINNEYTFGMNSIIKKYNDTFFRPSYYGIQDYIVYEALEPQLLELYKESNNVFISDRVKMHFKVDKAWNVFPLNMSYHAYDRWFNKKFTVKFSDDIHRNVYDGFSITISLIEIAVYMGFKEIYLLGADCSFNKNKPIHFVEYGVVDKTLDTARERNIAGYEAVKEYCDKNGIKVYNATRGGELEVFERVDLDKMFLIDNCKMH